MKLIVVVDISPVWKLRDTIPIFESLFAVHNVIVSLPDAVIEGTLLSDAVELPRFILYIGAETIVANRAIAALKIIVSVVGVFFTAPVFTNIVAVFVKFLDILFAFSCDFSVVCLLIKNFLLSLFGESLGSFTHAWWSILDKLVKVVGLGKSCEGGDR